MKCPNCTLEMTEESTRYICYICGYESKRECPDCSNCRYREMEMIKAHTAREI